LLQMIPVILGATFLIFAMVFALPGDPLAGKCGERPCSPAYAAAFRAKYNLNDPLPVQYGKYLGNLARGDLGETYNGIKVTEQLKLRYPVTAKLAIMAILFESILGVFAGVLTGIRKGGFLDNLVLVSTIVVISIPTFVIGSVSQYFLGVKLGLFPVTVTSSNPSVYELLLPAMVLGSISLAYVARLTRTNLTENLRADYLRTAVAKGLTRRRAIGLHAMRMHDRLAVVESPLDAVRLYQAGIPAVSSMGAFISDTQCRLLSRHTAVTVLALDNDDAGRAGTKQAIQRLRNTGTAVLVWGYDGTWKANAWKDPGDCPDDRILKRTWQDTLRLGL